MSDAPGSADNKSSVLLRRRLQLTSQLLDTTFNNESDPQLDSEIMTQVKLSQVCRRRCWEEEGILMLLVGDLCRLPLTL